MEYQEGIYFSMEEAEYHAIPYFSRSLASSVSISPELGWYRSHLNPDKPANNPTPQMELGTAVHCMLLEPELFKDKYAVRPHYSDYPSKTILDKNAELQNFLSSIGEKKTGAKQELIKRARESLDTQKYVIWDDVITSFNEDIQANEKVEITPTHNEVLKGVKETLKLTQIPEKILNDGYPEVTILWKDAETGIMCKCRLDYVRPESIGEVKTFSITKRNKDIDTVIDDVITYESYYKQFAVYEDALRNIILKINKKQAGVFGEVDKDWLNEFLKYPIKSFFFIFIHTQQPYEIRIVRCDRSYTKGATENTFFTEGRNSFKSALNKYAIYLKKYGKNRWIKDEIRTLADENVPNIMYQNNSY